MLIAFALSGCTTTTSPVVPALAVDPAKAYQPGRFVWYDFFSADAGKSAAFYGDLFGWELETAEEYGNFSLFTLGGRPVAGLIQLEEEQAKEIAPQWVPSLLVDDLDQAVERFRNGGSVLRPPIDVPDRGRIAVIEDNAGAPLILLETTNGVPVEPDGTRGSFLWTELWSADESESLSYYQAAVGYKSLGPISSGRSRVAMLGVGDQPQASILRIPSDTVKPHWLSYVAVEDPMPVAARAVALGGRVLVSPDETAGGDAAVIADPAGGIFGLQRWPVEGEEEVQP